MALNQERVIDPKIRSAYNGTGSTIVKGQIVKLATTPTYAGQVTPAAAATDPMYGVAMADILTLQWGDVQVGGVAIVLAGGTVAAGANVTSDAAGKGVAATSGNAILGLALTDGANAAYFEVELATPGGEANN